MIIENGSDRYSREFICGEEQEKIESSRLLLAGCGAGSAIVPYLARLGFGRSGEITLADPDVVDVSNLARQPYVEAQIGVNKAVALSEVIQGIDADIQTKLIPEGITYENVEQEIAQSDLVVEMIDVQRPDLTFLVHEYAEHYKKPLVTGLDVGEGIIAYAFDYRNPSQLTYKELLGLSSEVTSEDVERFSPIGVSSQLVLGVVPEQTEMTSEEAVSYYHNLPTEQSERILGSLPQEMHSVFFDLLEGRLDYIPQSGAAAGLLGSVLVLQAKQMILGNPVKTAPESVRINLLERIK